MNSRKIFERDLLSSDSVAKSATWFSETDKMGFFTCCKNFVSKTVDLNFNDVPVNQELILTPESI